MTALWPYALTIYDRPGVQPLLLALQEAHGQCVPLLLWALWMSAEGRSAEPGAAAQAAEMARAWQDAAIAPLRALRRQLKGPAGPGSPARRQQLRGGVQALELEAERLLLEMLEEASPDALGAADPQAWLALAAASWGGEAPTDKLDQLAALAAS
ncbi:MAG TPA: TIGR02444 family protein [Caulobacteraceae bacterium]|jgi:uncharacterized protein (TIGR02444 family)